MVDCRGEQRDDTTILCLSGELVVENGPWLISVLMGSLETSAGIEIDLSSVTGVDVACLQVLCAAHKSCILSKKEFSLTKLSEPFTEGVRQSGYSNHSRCVLGRGRQCLWTDTSC